MKVGIFYNSIANPGKFSNKVMLMDNFKAGVIANGDQVIEYRNSDLPTERLDAGFVLGYTLESNFRKKIIDTLRSQCTPQIFVDSNILHYAKKEHEWHRYSLNSVYPNEGVYFFDTLDPNKWDNYSKWHNATLRPWRSTGMSILILAQRPKGWNMVNANQDLWLDDAISEIRKNTNRPIVVRFHPGDSTKTEQINRLNSKYQYGRRVVVSTNENIRDDLKNAWCVVGYNSTPNVVAAIEGVPVLLADMSRSWAADIAFTSFCQLENPPTPDRTEWINKIANIHWSNEEVKSGQLWKKIRNYISTARL